VTVENAINAKVLGEPLTKEDRAGLSQADGFIKQSGGGIKFYCEAGAGTTVRLICLAIPSESANETRLADISVRWARRETLFMVEDEADLSCIYG